MTRKGANFHTLNDVNAELIRLSDDLEDFTSKLIDADTRATAARARADSAETRAFLAADGQPMEMRKHIAREAAGQSGEWEARTAEAEVRHAKAKIKACEQRIDSVRSVGANLKSEAKIYGSGYGAGS